MNENYLLNLKEMMSIYKNSLFTQNKNYVFKLNILVMPIFANIR